MFDREKRECEFTIGSTPVAVGPGKYDLEVKRKKVKGKSNASFGSTAERSSSIIAPTFSPGPGSYLPKSQFENIPGGKIAFKNGPRLAYTSSVENSPAPDTYFADPLLTKKIEKPDFLKKKDVAKIGVVFKATVDPPSIPTANYSFGYEVISPAMIKQQSPPKKDQTLGPAFYSPKIYSKREGLGSRWSKMSESRILEKNPQFRINMTTPGIPDEDEDVDDISQVVFKPTFGKQPRFSDKAPDAPAPSKYKLERFGDKATVDCPSAAFNSKLDRFKSKVPENPPVGSYDHGSLIQTKNSHQQNVEIAPFDSSSVRFQPNYASRDLGPASYYPPSNSLSLSSIRDAIRSKTVKGGFGSNSQRNYSFARSKSTNDIPSPGPGSYNIAVKKKKEITTGSSSFSSLSNRFYSLKSDAPPPTSYSVDYHSIKSEIVKGRRKKAFSSSVQRKDIFFHSEEQPGPADYSVQAEEPIGGGFSKLTRFKVAKIISPSPSTYPLNAIEENSTLLKKSFNKKLGTRPEQTMIREELTSSDIPANNLLINAMA
ncbi:unnamed protein product [Oikopleura dioica]|uniref:Sperm-tail PG-rich repeat-containing protein 2 n=1 Tax=Oikopleura dioica TaxID=34765 RepID=E4WU49_OIKDI|nr:unnamed protein product [Oikopleura dioica]